jgi:hypothetical protein
MPAMLPFRPCSTRCRASNWPRLPTLVVCCRRPERRYSVHEKECLAVVFGCEKYRTYLEHREFVLFTDDQALVWLLRHAKELGRIGRWVLRLAPFKFRVSHIRGAENVVADCLSRQYEEPLNYVTFLGLVLGQLPEAFHLIQEPPKKDSLCKDIYAMVMRGDPTVKKFSLRNGALVYHPVRGKPKRYLLPESLRPMVLDYFHCSPLSAHLGMTKTLNRISRVFYWPDMRKQVCEVVRACLQCQRAKPAQDTRVGLHSSEVTRPMESFHRFCWSCGPELERKCGGFSDTGWIFQICYDVPRPPYFIGDCSDLPGGKIFPVLRRSHVHRFR